MTHDELLIELNRRLEVALYNGDPQSIRALHAVVELHKPEPMPLPDEAEDDVCGFCWHSGARWFYPCPTIDAIEGELV